VVGVGALLGRWGSSTVLQMGARLEQDLDQHASLPVDGQRLFVQGEDLQVGG
jgi:hypothetical protein